MAELAALAGAPGIDVSVVVDVSAVVFAAVEVMHLLQEGLYAGWVTEDDRVEASDSELPITIIAHRVKLLLVIHEDSVICATKHFLNLDGQIKLRWN